MKSKILLIGIAALLGIMLFLNGCTAPEGAVTLKTSKNSYEVGETVELELTNNTPVEIFYYDFFTHCSNVHDYIKVFKKIDGKFEEVFFARPECLAAAESSKLGAGETANIKWEIPTPNSMWRLPIEGTYKIVVQYAAGAEQKTTSKTGFGALKEPILKVESNEFEISSTQPVGCPEDAKLCPDGTVVGRVPPNCEFAPCPADGTGEMQWLSYKPIQCQGNPWEVWFRTWSVNKYLPYDSSDEEQVLKEYFKVEYNIEILDYKQIPAPPGTGVCAACSCARGDTIEVLVNQEDIAKMLELGWRKTGEEVVLRTSKNVYAIGETIEYELQNNSEQSIFVKSFVTASVFQKVGDSFERLETFDPRISALIDPAPPMTTEIKPGEKQTGVWHGKAYRQTGANFDDWEEYSPTGTFKLKWQGGYSLEIENLGEGESQLKQPVTNVESNEFEIVGAQEGVSLLTDKRIYESDEDVKIFVHNNTEQTIYIEEINDCDNIIKFRVLQRTNGEFERVTTHLIDCEAPFIQTAIPVEAGEAKELIWENPEIYFARSAEKAVGTFKAQVLYSHEFRSADQQLIEPVTVESNEFEIVEGL